jgi:3-oxoacyl-[acyl-carrier-protein] synthase III
VQKIASLSAIHYELGDPYKIDDLDFLTGDPEKLNMYKSSGLVHYRKTDISVIDLCFNTITKTLKHAIIEKDAIDILLFVAETANSDNRINAREANNLILKLGLTNALPIAISLSDCANVLTGFQIGVSLVATKAARNVLLVCADKALQTPGAREVARQMSVLSDGAVSCIISEADKGDFDLSFITHKNKPSQWEMWNKAGDETNYSMEKFKSIVNISKRQLKQNGLHPKDIKKIITGNYRESICKMFIEIAGFDEEQGFLDNIPKFAHTLAGDIFINLKDYSDQVPLRSGEKIFLLADSYSSCGSALLIKA